MGSGSATPVVSVRDLHVTLGGHHILGGLSFDVGPAEIVSIIGPNGSGKTTLIKALLGLVPYTGTITVLGKPPGSQGLRLGYVPQKLDIDRSMPLTVRNLLSLFTNQPDRHDNRYRAGLDQVQAAHLLDRRLGDLSGGEFQRVLMALALYRRPELLILDEPAAGIDVEGELVLYEMLDDLKDKERLTILLVSHDLSVVYRYATSVLCVNHELICHGRPQEVLTADTLGRLYGHAALYHHPERPHPTVPTRPAV